MNQNRRYTVQGSIALAYCDERDGGQNIIDYDIARRSYEARCRLAARQAQIRQQSAVQEKRIAVSSPRRDSLQRIAEDSYTPGWSLIDACGHMVRSARETIGSHPFVDQLKHGSLRGRRADGETYHQVFSTTVACVVLSSVMVFIGM